MKTRRTFLKISGILLATLFLVYYNLPSSIQTALIPAAPEFFTKNNINLGLDLQGGSQLDYKINLLNVPEADRESIIEGVKSVIEKRVNALGVAEPNIYISEVSDETHIIVELAQNTNLSQADVEKHLGTDKVLADLSEDERKAVSLEKAKESVGKTIQLEFKEQKPTTENDEEAKKEIEETRGLAQAALDRIKAGTDFSIAGQEEQQANSSKATYEQKDYTFESSLSTGEKEALSKLENGKFAENLIEIGGMYSIDEGGNLTEQKRVGIVKLIDSKEEIKNAKEVSISKILIQYTGIESADSTVTRNKEEAEKYAQELLKKINEATDKNKAFEETAKEFSDDKNTKEEGGKVNSPITSSNAQEEDALAQTAIAFESKDQISEVIDTPQGYAIIKANEVKIDVMERQYKYELISYSLATDPWQSTELNGEHFLRADFQLDQYYKSFVSIQFDDEGAKMFEALTEKNVGKPIAIFVGGNLISAPNVNEKISGGTAQINGDFTAEEAKELARDLNTGAIPAPIVLSGEYTIGASIGKEALDQSVKAGMLGVGLIVIFMVIFYRLMGVIAGFSLVVYTSILIFLIKSQLPLLPAILIALVILAVTVSKVITNKDSGPEKFVSFLLACITFIFITFILRTGVVMTIAGTAGIILSMGMAVDANILIFERFKEEIRKGKKFDAAVETGFDRAWSSIRDSNFSTLITCGILFYFGSSLIKGFAFNLAAGVLVSMFTAITITKTLLQGFIGKKIAENVALFGASHKEVKEERFNFVKRTGIWLTISATAIFISIAAFFGYGLNLGIDFTGGTLMDLKFSEPVTAEQIKSALNTAADKVNATIVEPTAETTEQATDPNATEIVNSDSSKIDLSTMSIVSSDENNFIIKTKTISPENSDKLLEAAKESLPEFQKTRFNTIGPVLGAALLQDAVKAVLIAIVMIILYVAFAFRKVDKSVSKWKFGTAAVVALIHDVVITTGIFSILGHFTGAEINALYITAILTVMGYSVNDTIVVFDRLRENLNKLKGEPIESITNKSLNQTLGRSLNTSFSTMIALIAVLVSGNDSIFFFILALLLGIFVGTYSSIFLAAPMLAIWKKGEK